jgi:uncharacterized protein YdhG (YjbR/CyaY superfamily)
VTSATDEYLARVSEEHRAALEQLRATIRAVAPEAEEIIRSGVPAFRHNGKPLVSIGAGQRHVALYVMYGSVLNAHQAELAAYDTSNTVVRFDPAQPIPVGLVTKLVRARIDEVDGPRRK